MTFENIDYRDALISQILNWDRVDARELADMLNELEGLCCSEEYVEDIMDLQDIPSEPMSEEETLDIMGSVWAKDKRGRLVQWANYTWTTSS